MKRRAPAFVPEGGTTRRQVEASPNGLPMSVSGNFCNVNVYSEIKDIQKNGGPGGQIRRTRSIE